MERSAIPPSEFIASLPDDVRDDIEQLDAAISQVMAGHARSLWEGRFWGGSEQRIIGYGDLTYARPGGDVEWFIVGLAAQKRYLSVYINAADADGYVVERYADRLGKAKVGRSNISFRSVDDIDLGVLVELVDIARPQLPSHPTR